MATMRDIAKQAGVGVGTVSRALNGNGYVDAKKKEKILEVSKQLQYDSKKSLKKKNISGMIGVVLPDFSYPFWASFLKYCEDALLEKSYHLVVFNSVGSNKRVSEALDMVENHKLDGLIINADVTQEEITRLGKIPAVCLECEVSNLIPLVTSDHVMGGQIAAKMLIKCGCKNVAIVSIKAKKPVYARHRITECEKWLKRKGIHTIILEKELESALYKEMEEMINTFMNTYHDIDGIFTEDMEAYYCLQQAKKRGILVPRDLKIVGYDGTEITKLISPKITTIVQNTPQLALACVDILEKQIEGQTVDKLTLVPVKIRMGGTT